MARNREITNPTRSQWRAPKVEELGNLRDFVRTGAANGKSGAAIDGASMAGNETMN